MASSFDPFTVVSSWWGNQPAIPDTARLGIHPSGAQGAFECLILAILYSIEGRGQDIADTFKALQQKGYTNARSVASISHCDQDFNQMLSIFQAKYFGGRLAFWHTRQGKPAGKIVQIIRNAQDIVNDPQLCGDLSRLAALHSGNGLEALKWLRKRPGISKKAFWIMREMRMQGVWNVHGKYCCVPDSQVGYSLKRWGKIRSWSDQPSFGMCLQCSGIVWNHFGNLYDVPVLKYARAHSCSSAARQQCLNCGIYGHCSG